MQLDVMPAVTWDSSLAVKIANSGRVLEKNKEADGSLSEEYFKERPGRVRSRPLELLRLLSEPSLLLSVLDRLQL